MGAALSGFVRRRRRKTRSRVLSGAFAGGLAFLSGAVFGLVMDALDASAQAHAEDSGLAEIDEAAYAELNSVKRELKKTDTALHRLSMDMEHLHAQITDGFVSFRKVDITESRTAYPLLDPKLMIAADMLTGGPVKASFAQYTHTFNVGHRFDFRVDECECFLLLQASRVGSATFSFGCEELAERQDA